MRRHPVLCAGALAAALALGACDEPMAPRETIAPADFPRAAVGGDPRGYYEANSPLLWFFDLPSGVTVSYARNGGPGWIRFDGSASEGTYGSYLAELYVAATIDVRGARSTLVVSGDDGQSLASGYGSWRAIGGGLMELRAGATVDTLAYTVTDRGLFFIAAEAVSPGETVKAVMAYVRR